MSVLRFEEAIKDQKVPTDNLRSWYSWNMYSILAKTGSKDMETLCVL